jgi:hypothetical protein
MDYPMYGRSIPCHPILYVFIVIYIVVLREESFKPLTFFVSMLSRDKTGMDQSMEALSEMELCGKLYPSDHIRTYPSRKTHR